MLVRHCQRASFSPFWVLRTAASFSPRRFINTRYFRTQSGLIGTLDPESTSTMAASEVAFLKRLREDLISRSDHSRGVRNEGVDEEEQQQLDDQSSAAALSLFEGNFEEDPENAETLQNVFIEGTYCSSSCGIYFSSSELTNCAHRSVGTCPAIGRKIKARPRQILHTIR